MRRQPPAEFRRHHDLHIADDRTRQDAAKIAEQLSPNIIQNPRAVAVKGIANDQPEVRSPYKCLDFRTIRQPT